jgi:PPOX class probable F420-dependent enzyme
MTAGIRARDVITTDSVVVESDASATDTDRQLKNLRSGLPANAASGSIPTSHLDLVECPPVAALTTVMSNGYPQTSVVWCDFDDQHVRVNTMAGFAKERNMRRDPRVTLLCYDPGRPLRYLEIRGTVVEMTKQGAAQHLDALASKYCGRPVRYFGDVIPSSFAESEIPVLCLIRPDHVVALEARGGGKA